MPRRHNMCGINMLGGGRGLSFEERRGPGRTGRAKRLMEGKSRKEEEEKKDGQEVVRRQKINGMVVIAGIW